MSKTHTPRFPWTPEQDAYLRQLVGTTTSFATLLAALRKAGSKHSENGVATRVRKFFTADRATLAPGPAKIFIEARRVINKANTDGKARLRQARAEESAAARAKAATGSSAPPPVATPTSKVRPGWTVAQHRALARAAASDLDPEDCYRQVCAAGAWHPTRGGLVAQAHVLAGLGTIARAYVRRLEVFRGKKSAAPSTPPSAVSEAPPTATPEAPESSPASADVVVLDPAFVDQFSSAMQTAAHQLVLVAAEFLRNVHRAATAPGST
jgi:hypothetical protein